MRDKKLLDLFKRAISQLPKVTADIAIYGIGGSLMQVVGLITIPIITRILNSTEVGSLDVINATTNFIHILLALHLVTGLMRFFYEVSEDSKQDRKKMVSSVFWFTVMFSLVIVGTVSIFSQKLSKLLFSSEIYSDAILLATASLPFAAFKEIFASALRMQRKPIKYLIINLLHAIISFGLILIFILRFNQGINGYFTAQIISGIFVTIISAWYCRDLLGFTFSKKWFADIASYSLPMLPGGLLNWGMMSINRILLTQYTTETQIAYYSVATKTSKVIELAVSAFIMGWLPVFLANINSKSFHLKLDKVFRYYIYATISLSAFVTLFAKEFFYILAPTEYQVGVPLVALLCLKQALTGSTYTYTVGITQTKKSYFVSISTGIGVIGTILSSLLLLPKYGIFGAAVADVIGIFIYTLLMLIFSNNLVRLELNFKPIIWSILGFLIFWIISINLSFGNLYLDFMFRLVLLVIFLIILFVIIDRGSILNLLKKIFLSEKTERTTNL